MRKHWVALLSMLGLAGGGMRLESQVLKGSKPGTATESKIKATKTAGQASSTKTVNNGKLQVKQQTLRQQNQASKPGGKQADPLTPSAYCNKNRGAANNQQVTKGNKANRQLTPPPPGQVGAKSNGQLTKGNQQLTKGNQAITKGNQQLTKGNQQLTKGSQGAAVPK